MSTVIAETALELMALGVEMVILPVVLDWFALTGIAPGPSRVASGVRSTTRPTGSWAQDAGVTGSAMNVLNALASLMAVATTAKAKQVFHVIATEPN